MGSTPIPGPMSTYTIKKGEHSSFHLPGFSKASPASRTIIVNFSPSAWYEPSLDPERDWNKVWGWSVGILPKKLPNLPWYKPSSWIPAHHWNSIRLVNRPGGTKDDPTMELALYCYKDGVRVIEPLSRTFQCGEDISTSLYTNQRGVWELEAGYHKEDREAVSIPGQFPESWGYGLYPFCGGSYPAWETYSITLTKP